MPNQANCVPMLKALGDETRWRIVRELISHTMTVTELTEELNVTQYNISKHLRILREAEIVETEKHGFCGSRLLDSPQRSLSREWII